PSNNRGSRLGTSSVCRLNGRGFQFPISSWRSLLPGNPNFQALTDVSHFHVVWGVRGRHLLSSSLDVYKEGVATADDASDVGGSRVEPSRWYPSPAPRSSFTLVPLACTKVFLHVGSPRLHQGLPSTLSHDTVARRTSALCVVHVLPLCRHRGKRLPAKKADIITNLSHWELAQLNTGQFLLPFGSQILENESDITALDTGSSSSNVTLDDSMNCQCDTLNPFAKANCGGDSCTGIPRYLNQDIERMSISQGRIVALTRESFSMYPNLKVLDIPNNGIRIIEPGAFLGLTKLENLTLNFNKLTELREGTFQGLENLQVLKIIKNPFSNMSRVTPGLSPIDLPKLRRVHLGGGSYGEVTKEAFRPMDGSPLQDLQLQLGQITYLDTQLFQYLPNLRRLQLRQNIVKNLPEVLKALPDTVQTLDIGGIGLNPENVDLYFNALAGTRVKTLLAKRNNLPVISRTTFPYLPYIEMMNLSEASSVRTAEKTGSTSSSSQAAPKPWQRNANQGRPHSVTNALLTDQDRKCPKCHQDHRLFACPSFAKLETQLKWDFIKSQKRCFNCFSTQHSISACPSKYTCRHCYKRHHSLLCRNQPTATLNATANAFVPKAQAPPRKGFSQQDRSGISAPSTSGLHVQAENNGNSSVPVPRTTESFLSEPQNETKAFLQIVQLKITNPSNGKQAKVYALFDSGASQSWVKQDLAADLGLQVQQETQFKVQSFGAQSHMINSYQSLDGSSGNLPCTAYTTKSITGPLEQCKITKLPNHLKGLDLTSTPAYQGITVYPSILIGAQNYWDFLTESRYEVTLPFKSNARPGSNYENALQRSIAQEQKLSEEKKAQYDQYFKTTEKEGIIVKLKEDNSSQGYFLPSYILQICLLHKFNSLDDGRLRELLKKTNYVDDFPASFVTQEEKEEFRRESSKALESISMTLNEEAKSDKVLGITWKRDTDRFLLDLSSIPSPRKFTKRELLRSFASVYDPLGILSPFVMRLKILFQYTWTQPIKWDDPVPNVHEYTWTQPIKWDDPVPNEVKETWETWLKEAKTLALHLPRWVGLTNEDWILVCFTDANLTSMGIAVYCVQEGKQSHLLTGKSRLCPLKPNTLTVPRAELVALLLGVRLIDRLSNEMKPPSQIHLYTDSETCIKWINSPPSRTETFLFNRVTEIHQKGAKHNVQIKYVRTHLNPALDGWFPWRRVVDYLSGYTDVPGLKERDGQSLTGRWGSRQGVVACLITDAQSNAPFETEKFSSLAKVISTTAWLLRFSHFIRDRRQVKTGPLTPREKQKALQFWIRLEQQKHYPEEFARLKAGDSVAYSSTIVKLRPNKSKRPCSSGSDLNSRSITQKNSPD
ncbi:unnamed protein product, partial [Cyprideis torosa]